MKIRRSVPVLLASSWLALPGYTHAQRIAEGYHYDAPTGVRLEEEGAKAKLLNWVQQPRNSRTGELYFRNTADHPIQIPGRDDPVTAAFSRIRSIE